MSDDISIHGGHAASHPATAATPATDDDNHLCDMAREVAFDVLETARLDEGETVQATDQAVRILLLAAAELGHGINPFGQATAVSSMLMQAMVEALHAYQEPPAPAAA